jgi:hypothetical protein
LRSPFEDIREKSVRRHPFRRKLSASRAMFLWSGCRGFLGRFSARSLSRGILAVPRNARYFSRNISNSFLVNVPSILGCWALSNSSMLSAQMVGPGCGLGAGFGPCFGRPTTLAVFLSAMQPRSSYLRFTFSDMLLLQRYCHGTMCHLTAPIVYFMLLPYRYSGAATISLLPSTLRLPSCYSSHATSRLATVIMLSISLLPSTLLHLSYFVSTCYFGYASESSRVFSPCQ